jgi:hypothetical protein
LLNLSRQRGEDFNLTLVRYGTERLLYRIANSPYADRFLLKGAVLVSLWVGGPYRPTRDVDLMGYGSISAEELARAFREVCEVDVVPDGVVFLPETVQVEEIREDQEYQGQRVRVRAELSGADIPLQVDIGFGDAVTPGAVDVELAGSLDFPAPVLKAYPPETVVAEKFQAIVALGFPNSRLKDFYDVWVMSKRLDFDGATLGRAILATFERRRTPVPQTTPTGLSQEFASDEDKRSQWQGFLRRHGLTEDERLEDVVQDLRDFLLPPAEAVAEGGAFNRAWPAGGLWRAKSAGQCGDQRNTDGKPA